jgi:hypothetical protein
MKRRAKDEDIRNTFKTHATEINICIGCLVSPLRGHKQSWTALADSLLSVRWMDLFEP